MASPEESKRRVYVWGSGECDQLGIDGLTEAKVPKLLPFAEASEVVVVSCGGMHTAAVTKAGALYTWGCNDDGALGREGPEAVPGLVEHLSGVQSVATGDSHTAVLMQGGRAVYAWGTYRDAKGNMKIAERAPTRIGEREFRHKEPVAKVVSGANHTLVLVGGKVFAWGDSDSGQIGRIPAIRNRTKHSLEIESVGLRRIKDIFSGAYHSFAKDFRNRVFAWGLNNRGQLGDNTTTTTFRPHEIPALSELDVLTIHGGEHHSLALTKDGRVFTWGKNDDSQLGQGDDTEYREPRHVAALTDIVAVACGSQFNLAIDVNMKLYSWGMGDCFVLGNRQEENISVPTLVPPTANMNVAGIAAGSQHVVALVDSVATVALPQEAKPTDKRKRSEDDAYASENPPTKLFST